MCVYIHKNTQPTRLFCYSIVHIYQHSSCTSALCTFQEITPVCNVAHRGTNILKYIMCTNAAHFIYEHNYDYLIHDDPCLHDKKVISIKCSFCLVHRT